MTSLPLPAAQPPTELSEFADSTASRSEQPVGLTPSPADVTPIGAACAAAGRARAVRSPAATARRRVRATTRTLQARLHPSNDVVEHLLALRLVQQLVIQAFVADDRLVLGARVL